jgi:MoaA/NifB/PqqE/SkfB family radical SAM enzyme
MEFLGAPVTVIHLELTNRCVIACHRCSRTGSDVAKKPVDLGLDTVQRIFEPRHRGTDVYRNIAVTICGNYGDAIYSPHFYDIVAYLKTHGLRLNIITNGSHRRSPWWEKTAKLLTFEDRIVFSIDGLADTNRLYRVNSRWDDVIAGVRACVPHTKVQWKMIVFRHNEHQIDAARAYARELGVHEFRINKSPRFTLIGDDPLSPSDPRWIGVRSRNVKAMKKLLKAGDKKRLQEMVTIFPNCRSGQELFVSYSGYAYPCCTCALWETAPKSHYFSTILDRLNLKYRTLEDILSDPVWDDLQASWRNSGDAPVNCLRRCGVLTEFSSDFTRAKSISHPEADNLQFRIDD